MFLTLRIAEKGRPIVHKSGAMYEMPGRKGAIVARPPFGRVGKKYAILSGR